MAHPNRTPPHPTSLNSSSALTVAALALGQSLLIRGPSRNLRVFVTAIVTASVGEILIIQVARALRHHTHPQLAEVPLTIPISWYASVAPAYNLAQAAVGHHGATAVAVVTALLATAPDLANDPWGLDSGFWEWQEGGPYMADIVGANGKAGIPLWNYVGWLVISASVARLAEVDRPPTEINAARRWRTLLLLAYWLLGIPGLMWAVRERRWWLLMTSIGTVGCGSAMAWYAAHPK